MTLAEALEVRAAQPEAVPVAGGTDLMVAVNARRLLPTALLDLTRVDELARWEERDGRVFVGAGMTFARIARELTAYAPLADAARGVGSRQIRARATIGGNLATASPAGDGIAVLAAYDADVVLASRRGERRLRWDEFVLGPKRTALQPDELVVGASWRAVHAPGSFAKAGLRSAMVIAIAGVCVQLDPREHVLRLALGSVAPTVVRARKAEAFAAAAIDWSDPERPFAAVADFGRLAAEAARPIDDVRGSAAYRKLAVDVLARRALADALECWRAEAW